MKMNFKNLLFILLISSFSYSQISKDKQLHFISGAVISAATYDFVYKKTKSKKKAFVWSVASSVIAGLCKELLDQHNYGGFDKRDIVATTMGGVAISFVLTVLKPKKKDE